MGTKFMRRMVTLIVALAMVMTSGVFAFAASSPTTGKITTLSSEGSNGGKKITVTWKADKKADKYIVKVGSMSKEVTGTSTTFTTKAGTKYKVTVTPVYAGKAYDKGAKTQLRWMRTTTLKSAKAAGSKKVKLTWSKASGATGYKVMQYKSGKWVVVKTIKKGSTTSTTVKVAKKGTAKFRVRAMKGSYYGIVSKTKSVKVK